MKLVILIALSLSSCASIHGYWDRLVDSPPAKVQKIEPEPPKLVKYSENPQMSVPANNQYRRMTREKLEEDSELHPQAGSMWSSEGQSAFLFSQNKQRREGDILMVKMDAPAQRQIETKVGIIKKLLKQLEEQIQKESELRLAEAAAAKAKASESGASTAPTNPGTGERAPSSTSASGPGDGKSEKVAKPDKIEKNDKEERADLSEIQTVQTRVVEKLPDGNYRIKGHQPFMIDRKEYKVIISGVIRPEDFSDEGILSNKLIDSQLDVVSVRRTN